MHHMHFGIKKLFINCFVGTVDSKALCSREEERVVVGRPFVSLDVGMLYACYSLLASIEKLFPVTGLRIDFLKG